MKKNNYTFLRAVAIIGILLMGFSPLSLQAQCTYLNDQFLSSPAPTVVGQQVELTTCLFGGEYREMTGLQAGSTYRFETCGDTDFDTQITIFPAGGGASVAFNDDFCGVQSSVDFTPSTTGDYDVQINQFDCTTNSTCMTLWVTLVSGAPCDDNEVVIEMEDSFGDGWNGNVLDIVDENGNIVESATITTGSNGTATACLPDGCYTVNVDGGIFDSEVSWDIYVNGNLALSGGAPEDGLELDVNGGCGGGGGGDCTDNELSLALDLDFFASETSWEVYDENNAIAASGGGYINGQADVVEPLCLPDGCYDLFIYDSFGDGIFSDGDFEVLDASGNVIASGNVTGFGGFMTNFCASDDDGPTCEDGMQNGDEEGVDCGGSYCPPCGPVEGELPYPWHASVVGPSGDCNDFGFDDATYEFTVAGCGNNAFPGTTMDAVAFANQTICGDGEITLKVESITNNGYAGVMIRETEDANSKQVSLFSNLTSSLRHEVRYMAGANKVVQNFVKPAPYWLKLQRQGDWVFAYYSSTGMGYQYVHGVYIPMSYCVEIGMATFSYLPGAVATATFSNVNVVGSPAPAMETPGIEIADMDRQQAARLFPNPAQSNVTVEFAPNAESSTYLTLRNELGQVIEQRQLEPAAFRTEWAVESLNNGVYFIEINRDGEIPQVLRFVKAN